MDPLRNFAETEIATAPSPADTGVTLSVTGGDGSKFPDPSTDGEFNVVVFPSGEQPTIENAEIIRVTARSGDDFTVDRAQEGTSAINIAIGYILHLPTTRLWFDTLVDELADPTTGHEHDGTDSKQLDSANLI